MLDNKQKYFLHVVDREDETLEYLSNYYYEGLFSADFLLNYENNAQRILDLYSDEERFTYNNVAQANFLKSGTTLFLPISFRVLTLGLNKNPEAYKKTGIGEITEAWWTDHAKEYLNKTVSVLKQKNKEEYLIKRTNYYYIKIWSRVLNKVLFVTPHSADFNVSVTEDGGNFSFNLSAIMAIWKENEWQMANVKNFGEGQTLSKTNLVYTTDLNILFDTYSVKSFSDLYYEKVLNPQDLVFIKLDEPFTSNDQLDFDDFDMIGAIDKVNPVIFQNENNIECAIKINGRDLMKLFVEDGTYFYPIEFYVDENGQNNIIYNDTDPNFKGRIFGKLWGTLLHAGGMVKDWLDFVLTNLSVTNWDIPFPAKNGIWDWIEFKYEKVAGQRWITKPSIETMQGSVISYLRTLADFPFVEIIADTFGSKYSLIFRTPPYSKESYLNNVTLDISMQYLVSNDTGIDDKNMRSWFYMKSEALFFGDGNNQIQMAMFPPVYFSKLAKIFGSKKMDKQHKYSLYNIIGNKELIDSKLQSAEDFKWLIESFISEPFMKKGTLSFKNVSGIKRGMNIYIPETDMLYYVKSYSHSIGITDRITTVQVERGLPKSHIDLFYNLVKLNINEDTNEINYAALNEDVLKKLMEKRYE